MISVSDLMKKSGLPGSVSKIILDEINKQEKQIFERNSPILKKCILSSIYIRLQLFFMIFFKSVKLIFKNKYQKEEIKEKQKKEASSLVQFINLTIFELKKSEIQLQIHGLNEDANQLYKSIMRHQRERYRLYVHLEDTPFEKTKLRLKEFLLWLFDLISEFSINLRRILAWSIIFIIAFGIIYWRTGSINSQLIIVPSEPSGNIIINGTGNYEIGPGQSEALPSYLLTGEISYKLHPKSTDFQRANGLECIYFSAVTLINLGSEVFFPANFCGRIFEVIEAILGWAMLGMLLAFVTKRIK